MAIHTFGDYLDFHPHLHALVADGLCDRDGRCHVMRAFGIHRSFNYGATWEPVNSGIPTMSSVSLALGPDGHLYACVPGGVFRSNAPVLCIADLSGDSAVDGADLVVLLSQWGGAGTADFDRDGLVSGG